MIRSVKHYYRNYTNTSKIEIIEKFLSEYRKAVQRYIDYLWNGTFFYTNSEKIRFCIEQDKLHIPNFINYKDVDCSELKLSARALSAAACQAIGIVKGRVAIRKKLLFVIDKLKKENKRYDHLFAKLNKGSCVLSKPIIKNDFAAELSSKNIKFVKNSKYFELFIKLSSTGYENIYIPIKFHSQDSKWLNKNAKLLSGILISKSNIQIRFEIPDVPKKEEGIVVGADTGISSTITLSDNQSSKKDIHNHDLSSITDKLSKKTKGSKSFRKAQEHRKNYINWSINQLNLNDIKQINLEEINTFDSGNRSRKISHFAHSLISDKLMRLAEENGVHVSLQSCTYKSQRCSGCGLVRKANRKGKIYNCCNCNLIIDSDLNSAINNSLNLPTISIAIRQQELNRKGFFWKQNGLFDLVGQELRVPDAI